MMKRLDISEIDVAIGSKIDFFICSASFEDRCFNIAEHVKKKNPKVNSIIFVSGNSSRTNTNLVKIKSILVESYREARLSVSSPTFTADSVAESLKGALSEKEGNLLLDVTTFTHEQLLIVIRFLTHLIESGQTRISLTVAYTGADQYGIDANDGEMWLSRGVREIRPVLGFSGRFRTGLSTQLIILVGFEHERARAAVEYVEPATLSLGVGTGNSSISPELAGVNSLFCQKLLKFTSGLNSTFPLAQQFYVSLIDAKETSEEILKIADPDNFNVIVCPMNTKISTLGAAMAALADLRIQLMYVEPLEYNEIGYSIASAGVRISAFEPHFKQP